MRKFGKSIVTFIIVLSPIFIMGRPIVGRVEEDYYSIMGLNENSSMDEVLQAFYMLSEQYNPDTTNDPNAQQKLKKIRQANDVLSDPVKRQQYDYQRFGGGFQQALNMGYNTFGQKFNDGTGGNAFVWTSANPGGTGNFGWSGANGWGAGNGFNNNFAWAGNGGNAYTWGQGGTGGGSYGGAGGGAFGGAGGGTYGGGRGGTVYGNGGSAWVVGGGDQGAAVWAVGGSGSGTGAGGNGAAVAVSGGGNVSYESYTINGCTYVTERNGDTVTKYSTCD